MNEELKIIIKAVNDSAKKSINEVKKELDGLGASAKGSSSKMGAAMKGVAKGAAIAVTAIVAVGAAIVALGKKSLGVIKEQSKLISSFQAVGASAQQAETTYKGLYRFLGDSGKATEAAAHLALIANNQQELAEWTKISQGIYARFGDSLPIEGLTEAANETLKVGKVTGTLADALNWAGVSEDEFNAKLAATSSYEEREVLLRETLNGLYSEAAEIYEKNNKALLDYNESQARLDTTLAQTGVVITPLLTALNNLSSAFLNLLKPALDLIIPPIATFINWIAQAIQHVASFFSLLTGKSTSINATANNISSAASSANKLGSGMQSVEDAANGAATAAEKAKKAVMGFDELNVLSSGNAESGSSGASTPSYATPQGGFVDNVEFKAEAEQAEEIAFGLSDNLKKTFKELASLFDPAVDAWKDAFSNLKDSWTKTEPHLKNGANAVKNTFKNLGGYLITDFVPTIVNSFSVELAPVITDVLGFAMEEGAKQFEWFAESVETAVDDIVIPALDSMKMVTTDTFEIIGNTWREHGDNLKQQASDLFENLRSHFDTFYASTLKPVFDNVKKKFDEVWTNKIKPAFQDISNSLAGIGEDLLILYNKVIAPVVNYIIEKVGPYVVIAINSIIDIFLDLQAMVTEVIAAVTRVLEGIIGFITGVLTGDWEKAWEGIKDIFGGVWDAIVAIFKGSWQLIKDIFAPIGQWFKQRWSDIKDAFTGAIEWFGNLFRSAWTGVSNAWSGAKTFFSNTWTGIKNTFSSVGSWFSSTFTSAYSKVTGAFSNAKSGFSNVWSNIKSGFGNVSGWFNDTFSAAWTKVKNVFSSGGKIFDGIKDGILSGLKTVINGIITGINKVVAVPFNGINSALKSIKNVEIVGLRPFSWLPTISVPQIPKLAKGGVVDKATLAMFGEAGREAVLPLENNTEWMDKLADRIAARNTAPTKVVLQVGEKELGWATIGAINGITQQTGRIQLAI